MKDDYLTWYEKGICLVCGEPGMRTTYTSTTIIKENQVKHCPNCWANFRYHPFELKFYYPTGGKLYVLHKKLMEVLE